MLGRFLIFACLVSLTSPVTAYDDASIERAKILGRLQALVYQYSVGAKTCDINKIDLTALAKEKTYLFNAGLERERAEMSREETRVMTERAKPTDEFCKKLFDEAASAHVLR
jgi:hypothetical protein